jgi:hypothetical protein
MASPCATCILGLTYGQYIPPRLQSMTADLNAVRPCLTACASAAAGGAPHRKAEKIATISRAEGGRTACACWTARAVIAPAITQKPNRPLKRPPCSETCAYAPANCSRSVTSILSCSTTDPSGWLTAAFLALNARTHTPAAQHTCHSSALHGRPRG